MADLSYVDGKVREALVMAKGSRAMAQKILMAWAVKDDRLLLGMAQPFLKAIAAAAVERAGRRGAAPSQQSRPQPGRTPSGLSRDALEQVLSRMGQDDAPALAGGMRVATMEVHKGDAPGGVSHENAMKTLAKAFAAKKLG